MRRKVLPCSLAPSSMMALHHLQYLPCWEVHLHGQRGFSELDWKATKGFSESATSLVDVCRSHLDLRRCIV